jgi:hypothetical protein
MIETLIKYLLKRLAGITPQQWAAALLWVLNASRQYRDEPGTTKRERVIAILQKQFPDMTSGNLLTLVQVAWAWLNSTGKLK